MKKLIYPAIILIIFYLSSCKNENKEEIVINEKALIEKLSANNFYAEFYKYNIRPRDPRTYMIESDSLTEFLVSYQENEEIVSNSELENRLKSMYPTKYLEVKKTLISDLTKLISFMVLNGIKGTVRVDRGRVSFYLINDIELSRWCDKSTQTGGVANLKRFYDDVEIVDSNWVIFKNKKK